MMKSIPDRWFEYTKLGMPILGTKFISFKVPLKPEVLDRMDHEDRWGVCDLVTEVPRLKLVIDLTFKKGGYYNYKIFDTYKIKYRRIICEGHAIPHNRVQDEFNAIVDEFCADPENHDKLIGVHCTHGLNRSGFLTCQYMIKHLCWSPDEAIIAFQNARGHCMERKNYTDYLYKLKSNAICK